MLQKGKARLRRAALSGDRFYSNYNCKQDTLIPVSSINFIVATKLKDFSEFCDVTMDTTVQLYLLIFQSI